MSEARLLLVDDEVEFVEALADRLKRRGFSVHTATGGAGDSTDGSGNAMARKASHEGRNQATARASKWASD